jgi:hypothetical protein
MNKKIDLAHPSMVDAAVVYTVNKRTFRHHHLVIYYKHENLLDWNMFNADFHRAKSLNVSLWDYPGFAMCPYSLYPSPRFQ